MTAISTGRNNKPARLRYILRLCGLALAAGVAVVSWLVPAWGKYMSSPHGVTKRTATDFYWTNDAVDADKNEVVPVVIGDTALRVPAGYIGMLGSWSKEAKNFQGYLSLVLDMRDFLPHDRGFVSEVESIVNVWADVDNSRPGSGDIKMDRTMQLDVDGLEGWMRREYDGHPEIYRGILPSGERIGAACMHPGAVNAGFNLLCTSYYHADGVRWTYTYSRSRLPRWRQIHGGVISTIKSFQPQTGKK